MVKFRITKVAVCALQLVCCCVVAPADDIWAPDHELPQWEQIDGLQHYPVLVSEPPASLDAACAGEQALVRGAACLAMARAPSPTHVPLLEPLLRDSSPVVRQLALGALLSIESPLIKKPLLHAIATWKDLHTPLAQYDPTGQALSRFGLPDWLAEEEVSLVERRAWLAEFDGDAWRITFNAPTDPIAHGDGQTLAWAAMRSTEFNAGEPLRLHVLISRRGGKETIQLAPRITAIGKAIDEQGQFISDRARLQFEFLSVEHPDADQATVALPPDGDAKLLLRASQESDKLRPGFYLLELSGLGEPLLIRVRRARPQEERTAGLLYRIPDDDVVRFVGEQKYRPAAEPLIDWFRKDSNYNDSLIAEALGRIGDPAAIPVLLERPWMRYLEVSSDTSRALRLFGPRAYPFFEEYILRWPEHLKGDGLKSLTISLELLGPHGSQAADQARLDLLRAMSTSETDYQAEGKYGELAVLREALVATAPGHPTEVMDAVWATRDRVDLFVSLIRSLRQVDLEHAEPIVKELRRRTREAGGISEDHIAALMATWLPRSDAAWDWPIMTAEAAKRMLGVAAGQSAAQSRVAAAARGFLSRGGDASAQTHLGAFLVTRHEFQEGERLLREGLASQTLGSSDQVVAQWHLAEALMARGEIAEAAEALRSAQSLAKPGGRYVTYAGPTVDATRIKTRLAKLVELADRPPVAWDHHYLDSTPVVSQRPEAAGNCIFYLDRSRRLHCWNPLQRQGGSLGVMPNPVREFIGVDDERVFVLFTDGQAELYQLGTQRALWSSPAPVGHQSYLSASPAGITFADPRGVLRCLDPVSGDTRWQFKVPSDSLRLFDRPTSRGLVQQVDTRVLIPSGTKSPTRFACVELTSGKAQWNAIAPFEVQQLATSDRLVLAAGTDGDLMGLRASDGARLWRAKLPGISRFDNAVLAPDSGFVYLTSGNIFHVLDCMGGAIVGTWRWSPSSDRDLAQVKLRGSRLFPSAAGAWWLIDWESPSNARTEAVMLTPAGHVQVRQATSLLEDRVSIDDAIANDHSLTLRSGLAWETWRPSVEE